MAGHSVSTLKASGQFLEGVAIEARRQSNNDLRQRWARFVRLTPNKAKFSPALCIFRVRTLKDPGRAWRSTCRNRLQPHRDHQLHHLAMLSTDGKQGIMGSSCNSDGHFDPSCEGPDRLDHEKA